MDGAIVLVRASRVKRCLVRLAVAGLDDAVPKIGEPSDSTLWGMSPVLVQVQVTAPPTATVSTAWLVDPLCPLLKKTLPTMTDAVAGAGSLPPPPPLSPPLPPPVGPPPPPSGAAAAAGGWIHRCGVAGAPGYHGQDDAGQELPDHEFPLGMTARFAEPVSKGEY